MAFKLCTVHRRCDELALLEVNHNLAPLRLAAPLCELLRNYYCFELHSTLVQSDISITVCPIRALGQCCYIVTFIHCYIVTLLRRYIVTSRGGEGRGGDGRGQEGRGGEGSSQQVGSHNVYSCL